MYTAPLFTLFGEESPLAVPHAFADGSVLCTTASQAGIALLRLQSAIHDIGLSLNTQ